LNASAEARVAQAFGIFEPPTLKRRLRALFRRHSEFCGSAV